MPKFILGSGSSSRLALIKQAGFEPDIIEPADIDETPLKKEKPLDYVKRVSAEKCHFLHKKYYGEVILTADSIGETNIQKILQNNNVKMYREYVFKDLPNRRFDFYLPEYNRLIEFDGLQHFKFANTWHKTETNFKKA